MNIRDLERLDQFTRGYIECALWLADETPGSGQWAGQAKMMKKLDRDAFEQMKSDAADFLEKHAALLDAVSDAGQDDYRSGMDFWLTRNHHGAGFWDKGLGVAGENLTVAAQAYGEAELYEGDDKKLHHF